MIGDMLKAGLDSATGSGREWGKASERSGRWRSTAVTWFKKSLHNLHYCAEVAATPEQRYVTGWEAERLLGSILWEADLLIPALNDDDVEGLEKRAKALTKALRDRRLAVALADTSGRSEAEAALFKAGAEARGG